jgi:hypothetical protein
MFIDLVLLLLSSTPFEVLRRSDQDCTRQEIYRSFLELRTAWERLWGVVSYKLATPRGETQYESQWLDYPAVV